jgi:hypothetical protein
MPSQPRPGEISPGETSPGAIGGVGGHPSEERPKHRCVDSRQTQRTAEPSWLPNFCLPSGKGSG